jgi:hypothetical protein
MGTTITWSLSGSTLTLNGSTYALAFDDACGTFVASAVGVADCTFQLACGDVYAKQ